MNATCFLVSISCKCILLLVVLITACAPAVNTQPDVTGGLLAAQDEPEQKTLNSTRFNFKTQEGREYAVDGFEAGLGDFVSLSARHKTEGVFLLAADKRTIKQVQTVDNNKLIIEHIFISEAEVESIHISPDDKKLAVVSFSKIEVFDVASGRKTNKLTKIRGNFTAIAWRPDSQALAFGRADGMVFLWQLAEKNPALELEQYKAARSPVKYLKFHPAGRVLIVAERNGNLRFWRLIDAERAMGLRDIRAQSDKELVGREVQVVNSAISPLGAAYYEAELDTLFLIGQNGQLITLKVRGLKLTHPVQARERNPLLIKSWLNYRPEERLLFAIAGRAGTLELGCMAGENPLSLAYSSDNSQVLRKLAVFPVEQRLWAVEKLGRLLIFESARLFESLKKAGMVRNCH